MGATFFILGTYVVFLGLLRRKAIAIPAYVVLTTLSFMQPSPGGMIAGAVNGLVMAVVTIRFGVLASVATGVAFLLLGGMPLPLDPGSAYWVESLLFLIPLLLMLAYAMRVSVGTQPLFRFGLED
jgi:hypothetical protein